MNATKRHKECRKCHLVKPLTAFNYHSWLEDGWESICKDCRHKYRRFIPHLYARDGFLCRECLEPLEEIINPKKVQVDHVKPRRVGGEDNMDNLQLLHTRCNVRKIQKDKAAYG